MRLDAPFLARRGRLARLIAVVFKSGVRLRRLLVLGSPEPRYAAEQSFEDIAGP